MKLTDIWAQRLYVALVLVVALAPLIAAMWLNNGEIMLLYIFYAFAGAIWKLIDES